MTEDWNLKDKEIGFVEDKYWINKIKENVISTNIEECKICDVEFLIKFDNDIPHHSLFCPICGIKGKHNIRVVWIDRANINKELDLI